MLITITFEVTPLPENDVWFANSQAWSNYWKLQHATASIEPIATIAYTPLPYDESLVPCYQNIDGTDYILVTKEMFDSLRKQVNALDASYQALRDQLKNNGFILNP